MNSSQPHRCLECSKPDACGLHGILVFADGSAPLCRHNERPGKPCHSQPVRMVPVGRRQAAVDLLLRAMSK